MHSILVMLDGPSNVEINCDGKLTRQKLTRGDVTIVPYRFSIEGARVEPCEFLQLWLKPSVIDRAARELGFDNRVELAPVVGVVDPLAEQTIHQLEEELTTGPRNSDYVNVLVDTLAKHVVTYYAKGRWTSDNTGGFPKYLLDRILQYIDDNRLRDLSPAEIASAVGVDPDRFSRAFKAATGNDIHHYLKK